MAALPKIGGAVPASPAPSQSDLRLTSEEKRLLYAWVLSGATAVLLPFPATKIALAAVLGLLFLRASAQGIHLAIALFVMFLPFLDTAYKGSILIPGVNLQTLFVLYFAMLAALQPSSSNVHAVNRAGRALLALACAAVVSAVYASMTSPLTLWELLTRIKNWFAYAVFLPIMFRHVREPRHKMLILLAVFVSVTINVLFSLREVSLTLALSLNFLRHRATSFISAQPNLYGGFLALYVFFMLALLLYYPMARRYRGLLMCAIGLVVVNLMYTMSRGAWLAAIAATAFLGGRQSRRIMVPAAIILVGMYFWAPDMASERWDSSFEGKYDPSLLAGEDAEAQEAATRIIQWRNFLPMMAMNPVFGVGFARFPEFFRDLGFSASAKSAHSSVIEFGVEMGVVGIALYGLVLWLVYRGATRVFKSSTSPLERSLGLGLAGATVCLFLLDLTGTRFRNGEIMAYFWMLAAITLNSLTPETGHTAARPAHSPQLLLRRS